MAKVISMFDSPEKAIRDRARKLPIYKCLVNHDWQESKMANLVVIRKHVNGNVTAGIYLVDLLCTGVKDSIYRFNVPEEGIMEILNSDPNTTFIEIEYTLAHNIIYAGIEFADAYELKPCKDFKLTQFILAEDTDDIPIIEIVCGDDDKPLVFISKSDSNAKLIAHLNAVVGPDGFEIVDLDDVDDEDDENQFFDDEDQFWTWLYKKYPNFKEVADWDKNDIDDYLNEKKKYPRFQDYQFVDAMFQSKFPEFDYLDDECPEFEAFNELEINDELIFNHFSKNEEEMVEYLRVKELEISNSPNLISQIDSALLKFPDSTMLEFSKLDYLTNVDEYKALEYNLMLIKKFPKSILMLTSAIGLALYQEKYELAESLIAGKFHPHHHISDITCSSIEASEFYANMSYFLASKNELLKADYFILLAEKAMNFHPYMSKDDGYIEAKEFIMAKKSEILFPEKVKELRMEANKYK